MIESFSMAEVTKYINNFHALAPGVAFGLFFIQAVFPVFPYVILAGAAGMLFGFWEGFLLAWLGALSGACAAFVMARHLGYDWFSRKMSERYRLDLESINPHYGFWSIVLARIIPVVPTPLINVAAGVGGVSFRIFTLASAIGKLPTALIYTGLGYHFYRTHDLVSTITGLVLVLAAGYLVVAYLRRNSS
ncbi:MAG: TVP38/TMEM64 family protein [Syntrophothermus sp.]|uniref:TVP38/TMEM64 family protein n=1 Tax=Syntrophothermus sp. TaxID=2736299 RepID=UPI00257A8093|nr:TVP38/TMEM64 family protein [Syntrophothermus sp.]NSW83419.1 TVP38/TMEM64 family protein [Syntrophothermus sp.]